MSNDTSVFPVALLENAVSWPITYQGEVRGSPTHANNSADAIMREAIPSDNAVSLTWPAVARVFFLGVGLLGTHTLALLCEEL
jgi:hypothetical protein